MTRRQQDIVSGCGYYQGFATKKETKKAKKLACGKFWHEKDDEQYCAVSPGGKREFFMYDKVETTNLLAFKNVYNYTNRLSKQKARRAAALWAKGHCRHARMLDYSF